MNHYIFFNWLLSFLHIKKNINYIFKPFFQYAEQVQAMQAMGGMPPLPPASAAPPPAPPPPDKSPPPPHENNQPLYANTKPPPQPPYVSAPKPPPPTAPVPPAAPPSSSNQWNNQYNQKTLSNNDNWSYNKEPSNISQHPPVSEQPTANNPTVNSQSSGNLEALKKLSEEERLFDIQFKQWEQEIEKWRKENQNHPDKQAYKEYEQKFEACRLQLMERRRQMKLKRDRLMQNTTQSPITSKPSNAPILSGPNINMTKSQNIQTENYSQSQQNYSDKSNNSNFQQQKQYNMPQSYNKSDNKNIDPQDRYESYRGINPQVHEQDNYNAADNSSFLPSSDSSKGIPGLDLVPDVDKGSNKIHDVVDITEDNNNESHQDEVQQQKDPDYSTISKGINNILGDEKIMNILSMVQNHCQPPISNPNISASYLVNNLQENMPPQEYINQHNFHNHQFENSQQNMPQNRQLHMAQYSQQNMPQSRQQNIPLNRQQNIPQNSHQNMQLNSQQNMSQNRQQNMPHNSQQNMPQNTEQNILQHRQQNMPQSRQQNITSNRQENMSQNRQNPSFMNQQNQEMNFPLPLMNQNITVPALMQQNIPVFEKEQSYDRKERNDPYDRSNLQSQYDNGPQRGRPAPSMGLNMASTRPPLLERPVQQNFDYPRVPPERHPVEEVITPVQPPHPKWVDEPLFSPYIIVEYEHKPLRLKGKY